MLCIVQCQAMVGCEHTFNYLSLCVERDLKFGISSIETSLI